jgi:hypothetical protein
MRARIHSFFCPTICSFVQLFVPRAGFSFFHAAHGEAGPTEISLPVLPAIIGHLFLRFFNFVTRIFLHALKPRDLDINRFMDNHVRDELSGSQGSGACKKHAGKS